VPKVSVVIPTYNVARWLPEFLASLDAQTAGLSGFELIFVDDGSTDDSAAAIRAWIARGNCEARLVGKDNGGLSSARNAGLEVASGGWVTFWDPDDVLSPEYAAEIREFVDSPGARGVDLIVGRLVKFAEVTGRRSRHPLDYRFARGDRVIDLEAEPDCFHLAANTAFFRIDVLRRHDLRFDARVVPSWEDGHLIGRYLSLVERPRVAVRSRARYLYRQRADQSSLVQSGWRRESKYLAQPRYGWLDMLSAARANRGHVPAWAQYTVLYEIAWYFKSGRMVPPRTAWVPDELAAAFHATLGEVLELLDPVCIANFAHSASEAPPDMIAALLIGGKGQDRRPAQLTIDHIDRTRRLARLRYYFDGELPDEQFRVGGVPVRPSHAKTRLISFLGRPMAAERIVWLPATDSLSLTLDGNPIPVRIGPAAQPHYEAVPDRIWWTLTELSPPREPRAGSAGGLRRRRRELLVAAREFRRRLPKGRAAARRMLADVGARRLAATPPARRMFHDAWLLTDGADPAFGNAEHLYRYLRAEQPQINAWFVLDRGSPDWDRLVGAGFRLLERGGHRHKVALLHARHLVSSRGDDAPAGPSNAGPGADRSWRYTYLPDEVITDDRSNWLNPRSIDLLLTTNRDEHTSIVADDTAYRFTSLEVVLTGAPRHDRLQRLGESASGRDTVLVVPAPRRPDAPWHRDEFVRSWRALLGSDRLRKAVAASGHRIVLVPPDGLAQDLAVGMPPGQLMVSPSGSTDIQELIAGAAIFVTDYSSGAFDAAYLHRAVVYHQFDADAYFAQPYLHPRGSWNHRDHGFGPVCVDPESALDAIIALIESGCAPEPRYAERMTRAFSFRDGNCCARVHRRIRELEGPVPETDLYEPADQPRVVPRTA